MKLQKFLMSAAMLAVFVLTALSAVIRLAQFVTEVIRLTVRTIAKIDWLKGSLILLSEFDWIFSRVNKVVNSVRSSLEDWMASATVKPTTILSLLGENNFLNKAMKLQRFLTSAAMLTVFVFLAALSLLAQSANQAFLLGCKAVKEIQKWILAIVNNGIVDATYSSLEDWMLSMVVEPTSQNQLLLNANSFPSERTPFEYYAISSLELPITQHIQPATTNSLELAIAPTLMLSAATTFPSERTAFNEYAVKAIAFNQAQARKAWRIAIQETKRSIFASFNKQIPTKTLMLTAAKSFPSERTAFEECAVKAIAHSLELTVAESIASLEAIVEVTAQPLGRVITIGSETGLIPLSFPGVYVQRTPKQEKLSKSELNSLTVPELRDRIAKAVKNNNSLVAPKSYKKAKKVVLVDWLMAN